MSSSSVAEYLAEMERSGNPRKQVVVVDPYEGAVDAIRLMLEDDWEVVGLTSGEEALRLLRCRIQFHALIAAVELYPVGGLELCAAALQLPRPPRTILVTTGRRRDAHSGEIPVLEKPFSSQALRSLLE